MDIIESDKNASSRPARDTIGIKKLSSSRLPAPVPLPSMKWMLPSISRCISRSLSRNPQIATQLPTGSESVSASHRNHHHHHSYHHHNTARLLIGHDASCPYTSPILSLGSGYSLSAKRKSNIDGNGIHTITNVTGMKSKAVGGTTSGNQLNSILPLPDVAAKTGQVDAGVGVVATNMGALDIAAANATYRLQQKKKAQLHYCHLCNKRFKRRSWLQRHLLSHSSQRHYGCPWCISKHKRKDNLLQHMKLKHTGLVVKEMQSRNHYIEDGARNNNIRGLLDEGRLNKDDVKKVLHTLINKYNE